MELKEHIDDIRNRLEQKLFPNETAVRLGIVDRLLNALGWETFDTHSVFPEYPINGGRVDYALCHPPGKPIVFIEVKRVGNIEGAERQLFEYAFHEGVPILILTDGQKWRFFHPSGAGDYQERLVWELDLTVDDSEAGAACLNRYLNYTSIQTGTAGQAIVEDYQKVSQQREALRRLPEAWENLLSGTSENSEFLIEVVQSETEYLCGSRPTHKQIFDFLNALSKGTGVDPDLQTTVQKTRENPKAQRQQRQVGSNEVKPPSSDQFLRSRSRRKEKYTAYFQELIDQLRKQHNFTKARRAMKGQNYYPFASGATGIKYVAGFNKQQTVYMILRINFGDREKNKRFFDVLKEREAEITAQFDVPLYWDRRDDVLRCHIYVDREGTIDSDASALETFRAWHIENLLKFKAVFTPEIEMARATLKSQ